VRWTFPREGDISLGEHGYLARMLQRAYPDHPDTFDGVRSWSWLRSEARVVGHDAAGVAAQAGILRRFIQIANGDHRQDQLVAFVGMVAVRPDLQGLGVGVRLMANVATFLADLGVPFGLLMCNERRAGFYQACGWQRLSPRRVVYSSDDCGNPSPFIDEIEECVMVLPVSSSIDAWPEGDLLWHCAHV
jgi:nodulation protein A